MQKGRGIREPCAGGRVRIGLRLGADQVPLLAGVLDSVHAAGVQLGVPKWGIALKYLHEFEARQRFQGQIVTFTFGLPLDPLVDLVKGLVE